MQYLKVYSITIILQEKKLRGETKVVVKASRQEKATKIDADGGKKAKQNEVYT